MSYSAACKCSCCNSYRKGQREGIKLAASVAADYDHLSSHDYKVSECILGKLNVLKRKPRRNRKADRRRKGGEFLLGSVLSKEKRRKDRRH